jgi:dienelactone hydrolase
MSQQPNETGKVNVDHFLSYDYKTSGSILKLKDNTEFYGVGSTRSKHGVIVLPDTGGYNAGNIRNIADFIAANDIYVAIPTIMGTPKETGQTLSFTEAHSLGEYTKSQVLDGNMKPKVVSLSKYMFNEGVERIALVGFSWGGWVAANILASDISDHFVCGILAHPSINLEERMYAGSLVELFSHINRPLLVLPARGDPHEYDSFVQMLKYRCPSSDVIDYRGYEHNFLLRGRIDDRDIRNADAKALNELLCYLNYHFNETQLGDLCREAGSVTGAASGTAKMRSWREYFEQTGQYMREGAQYTGERMQQGWDKTKEDAKETGDRMREGAQQTGERMQEGWDQTKQRTEEGWDQTKQGTQQTGERMQEGWDQTKQRTQEGAQQTKQRTQEGWDQTKQGAQQTGNRMQEGAQNVEKRTGEAMKQSGERMKEHGSSSGRGR